MIEPRKRGSSPKDGADPDDSERTGVDHGAERRIERVSAAAKCSRRNFIQVAERLRGKLSQNQSEYADDNRQQYRCSDSVRNFRLALSADRACDKKSGTLNSRRAEVYGISAAL